jgi:hypothetical protein
MMKFIIGTLFILLVASCTKKFLEEKVSSQYELADNLNNLSGLFNNDDLMGQTPVLGEQSSDDYYMTEEFYNNILHPEDTNAYCWKKDIFEGKTGIPDWDLPYAQIFAANLALDGLKKIAPGALYQQQWNEIKGSALFFRSYSLFNLSQVFAKAYDSTTAEKELGVPIPLEANTEIIPPRSSMKETYRRIINDLTEALSLVAVTISPLVRKRPNKPAVFALLARVYLFMRNYTMARACADSSLHYQSQLINYNKIKVDAKYPIAAINEETLYQSWLITTSNVIQGKIMTGVIIDSVLYKSYDTNDLRKKLYFVTGKNGPIFNTGYSGRTFAFSGLATDEAFLVRAECNARLGNVESAMTDLNWLLENRYKTGTAPSYNITIPKEALNIILKERRKELVFRGLRWLDIKRLNKEEAMEKIVPRRFIHGQPYQLPPSSNNYALPLPDDALREGIILQNERE